MKNIFKIIIVLVLFAFTSHVYASEVLLVPSVHSDIGIGEQFYVDVMLDPGGILINGIDAQVSYNPAAVSFVRAETGSSLVGLWITDPKQIDSHTISFAGIMPNGFGGVIDPFNPKHKLPGLMARLVFEGQKAGDASIILATSQVTRNDGYGTIENPLNKPIKITVENNARPYEYINASHTSPTLDVKVVRDQNLYDNKYVLVYRAVDRGSGIKEVLLREGDGSWKKIESPYVLTDQHRHSILALQANNFSGESVVTTIDPLPNRFGTLYTIVVTISLLIFIFVIYKIYVHRKNKQTN
jgi:hypothetical protein